MVWTDSAPPGRQAYAVFRKRIELAAPPEKAVIHLFADSRYILWINGQYVERGPCRFDPRWPEYDTVDVKRFLLQGRNALAILVHHYHDGKDPASGAGLGGRMMRHPPGLGARLEITDAAGKPRSVPSDATWRVNTETRFTPSPLERWQDCWASIPDRIDARKDTGDWTLPAFDDAKWPAAVPVDDASWGPLASRAAVGIPLLRETDVRPLTLIDFQSVARQPLREALPLQLKEGEQIVVDAGRFVQAYSTLAFDAASGSVLELEYPQTYGATGHKPGGSYGRVNRYVARSGRQTYVSGDTFGCRYMVVRCRSGSVTLRDVKLTDRLYPFDVVGRFHCNEEVLNSIWRIGVNTILACSEDAYVDCATRERVEWLADGLAVAYPVTRVAFAGPAIDGRPAYGDARLLRNLLRHVGQSQLPDGRVKAHHPSDRWDKHGYIEDYACLWIQGIRTYVDHTGEVRFAREQWPAVRNQLQWFLDRRTERGLAKAREFVYFGNPLAYQVCEGTTLNCYLHRALLDAAELARVLGEPDDATRYAQAAAALGRAINEHLWDEESGAYHGAIKDGAKTPPTAHAAAIALCDDVVPASRLQRVRDFLLANYTKEGFFPYTHRFLLEILYEMNTDATDRLALELIRKRWAGMTAYETQTTWEGFHPGENCHESGASPTYFLSAYVLGVRLDGAAAERRLLVQPRLADLTDAGGVVVTELGPVPIAWQRNETNTELTCRLEIPDGGRAVVDVPRIADNVAVTLDGRGVTQQELRVQADNMQRHRFVQIEIGAGKHEIRVTPR